MDEVIAIDNLRRVKTVLDAHKIDYWLDVGTLLGAVRDNKIIPWDHDIDLGTWQNNTSKICQRLKRLCDEGFSIRCHRYGFRLEKQGCPLSITMYKFENGCAKVHWGANDIHPWLRRFADIVSWAVLSSHYANVNFNIASNIKDIFCLVLCRLGRVMPDCLKEWAKKIEYTYGKRFVWVVPADYFFYLSTMKFYGMEFKIPAKTEEYLIYRYGEDWRIPKKDWITGRDDGAVFNAREYFEETICRGK